MTDGDTLSIKAKRLWEQRTSREKLLGVGAAVVLSGMFLYSMVISPVREAFARQSADIKQLTNAFSVAPDTSK